MYWLNTVTLSTNRHELFLAKDDPSSLIAGVYWNNGYLVQWTTLKGCSLVPVSREEQDVEKVKLDIEKAITGFVIAQSKYYDTLYYYMSKRE